MVEHVIQAASGSALFLNKKAAQHGFYTNVVLLVPEGDPLRNYTTRVETFEGPLEDVLGRYHGMTKKCGADWIVRLTADCPLLYPAWISRHIVIAVHENYDYFSNVCEGYRTCPDGFDVEVFPRRTLEWLHHFAKTKYDREHVTTLFRQSPPEWAKQGHAVGHLFMGHHKLSVDTIEDLELVRAHYDPIREILEKEQLFEGRKNIHRV